MAFGAVYSLRLLDLGVPEAVSLGGWAGHTIERFGLDFNEVEENAAASQNPVGLNDGRVMLGMGGHVRCVVSVRPGSVCRPALGRVDRSERPEAALRPGPARAGQSVGAFRPLFAILFAALRAAGDRSGQTGPEKRNIVREGRSVRDADPTFNFAFPEMGRRKAPPAGGFRAASARHPPAASTCHRRRLPPNSGDAKS